MKILQNKTVTERGYLHQHAQESTLNSAESKSLPYLKTMKAVAIKPYDKIRLLEKQLEEATKLNHKYFDTLYRLKKIKLKEGKYVVNNEWEIPAN